MSQWIGYINTSTALQAGGIWNISQQAAAKKGGIWPYANADLSLINYTIYSVTSYTITVGLGQLAIVVTTDNTSGLPSKLYTPMAGYSGSGVYLLTPGSYSVSFGGYGGMSFLYTAVGNINAITANYTDGVSASGICYGTGTIGCNIVIATGQTSSGSPTVDFDGLSETHYSYGTYFFLSHAINKGLGNINYTTSNGTFYSGYSTIAQINIG